MYKHELVTPENSLPAWIYLHDSNSASYIEPHWHSSVEISYTISGHIANFFIDGQSYTTSAGTILVTNTMDLHSIRTFYNPDGNQKGLTIIFPYQLIKTYKEDIGDYRFGINNPRNFSRNQKKAYVQLQKKLDRIADLHDSDDILSKTILLFEILQILLEKFLVKRNMKFYTQQDTKDKERLQEIKTYIEEHFQADISLEDIASFCFLSKEHLSRFFKKQMGITVFQYINYIRAKEAKKMLSETQGTATQIALNCGFSGLRTMDRALQKTFGQSSREIKKQARQ